MAIADSASSLTVGAAIAAVLWLAASQHLSLASAVAGTAALVMLGGRIAFAGVEDFLVFARLVPPVTAPRERAGKPAGPAERANVGKIEAQDVMFSGAWPGWQ